MRTGGVNMFDRLKEWNESRKRGEKRVAPKGQRGRVYAGPKDAPNPPPDGNPHKAAIAKGQLKVSARVIRADGTIEDLGVISDG